MMETVDAAAVGTVPIVVGESHVRLVVAHVIACYGAVDRYLGVLAETAVGPMVFGGSIGDSGHRKWFFQLGRVF
jgi:hypothetical protein